MKKILIVLPFMVLLNAVTVEQLFNVKTIKVKREEIKTTKSYNGYAKIADNKVYTIALTQDGFVKNLTAPNIYDKVTKGRRLFDFYSPNIYKAQIELVNAKKFTPALIKSLERKLRLYDVTTQNIKKIKRENRAFKYLPYYSPYSGIVIEKRVTEGSAVKQGEAIYKIADLSTVWVEAKAYEADREFIKKGQKVEVTFNGDKRVYYAHIDLLYPLVDRVNRTIDFRVVLKNKSGTLQPNSYATIKIIISQKDRLVLPNTAVITKGEKHLVFLPSEYEGEYKSKLIEAKRISMNQFEIISGLNEGDIVVNNVLFLLDSDVAINGDE